jgi:hypothetical protein
MVSPLLVPVIGGIIETVGKVADDLITSDEERQKLALEAYEAETERARLQTEINVEEAKSGSTFVAGARPAIMWICAFAMGYATVLEPIMRFIAQVMVGYAGTFPVIDTELTMQVLFGLLGLGAYRTFEKMKGVASK